MNKNLFNAQFAIVALFILSAAIIRLLSFQFQLWNFTPIGAMALFSGAYMKDKKMAFIIPLAAMLLSDAFIGFYNGIQVVYVSMCLIVFIGFYIQNKISVPYVLGGSLAASIIFFLVTNFALIYPASMYPHSIAGILQSYTAGLPFFKGTLTGDLIFTALLFGGFELVKRNVPAIARAN